MKIKSYLFIKAGEALLVIAVLLLCLAFKSHGQVQPSKLFSNGMVLQRDTEIRIWGKGTAGAAVTVSLNGASANSVVGENGKWNIALTAMEAGGPFQMVISSGTQTLTYNDVYIGDVWLASGQSNMEMALSQADNSAAEIASANNPKIRQFKIPKTLADEPSDIVPTGSSWTAATTANAGNFSAAGYYFAKALYNDLMIPIGIINTSYGGSRIEAWMSEELLGYDESDVVLAGGTYQERQPTKCYNQMLKPLEGFPIKGFIWYQGESNADNIEDALEYGSLFKKMIFGWRNAWGMGDLPFIWVQLPNFSETSAEPQTWDAWPQLRANQSRALALPNTAEAVTIDVGDVDIHPKNKKPVGDRLALAARKIAYNEAVVFSGPRYKSHRLLPDGKVVIAFDHADGGLSSMNPASGAITGFSIANSNGTLSWADASISGDSVIVWNNAIANPSVVRYAWEYNPVCNLYNAEGLPASPFKINVTDPGFSIKSFATSATELERGQSAVLSWETYGATNVTLNDEAVDPISGKRIIPTETTTYTLKITGSDAASVTKSVTITVVDPKPTISISTSVGGVTSPGTEITLIATATAPKGRTVKQIDFYIDNKLVGTSTKSPYEVKWTPSTAGQFSYTAKVTDNTDVSITSAQATIFVTKLKIVYYEAENATWTGTGSIMNNSKVSGKKYVDFASQDWTLTFNNVEVPEAGEYPMTIGYLLNYQSPKNQTLIINGKNLGEIQFTAPNTTTWSTYFQQVSLNKGMNTIELKTSWGWMSFDYISIAIEDTSTVGTSSLTNQPDMKLNMFPNPIVSEGTISYFVPEDGNVTIEIFSAEGKKVKALVNEKKTNGLHDLKFDTANFKPGVYLAKITMNAISNSKRFVIIR
jgi:sialate O-acetylesterase